MSSPPYGLSEVSLTVDAKITFLFSFQILSREILGRYGVIWDILGKKGLDLPNPPKGVSISATQKKKRLLAIPILLRTHYKEF